MNHEEFERLKPEEQEEVFHKVPFRERGELLLRSHDPLRLAQSLSQEELYLVTREMDLEERSEVIRYANLPQLFFIADIDCWKKDRLNPKRFLEWIETLKTADEERLLAWLVNVDYETVVTGFKGLIRVLKPEWEYPSDEALGDEPYFTLDERYFVFVKEENIEIVRRAIEILFENHRGRYVALLEGILGELDYELEEEAFQNRSRRLAERGFPDPETAHHIYRPITREEFENFPKKNLVSLVSQENSGLEIKAPHYLTFRSLSRLFLDEVLLLFREERPEVREGLEEELAWLSNKVVACEGIDFASEDRVRRGIERARRLVSMGLEDLSGGDLSRARAVLREQWLELLFRWGASSLMKLQEEAQRIVEAHWGGERKYFLEFLDPPYESIFQGLFKALPQAHDPKDSDSLHHLRDFQSVAERERTRLALRQIQGAHEVLTQKFPRLLHRLNLEVRRRETRATLFSLLGTLFASWAVGERMADHPLSEKEFSRFLHVDFEDRGNHRVLRSGLKEKFLTELADGSDTHEMKPFWALFFQRLEEELGRVDPDRTIDPRFVTCLSLEKREEGAPRP